MREGLRFHGCNCDETHVTRIVAMIQGIEVVMVVVVMKHAMMRKMIRVKGGLQTRENLKRIDISYAIVMIMQIHNF